VSDEPSGIATLTAAKLPDTAMIEIATPSTSAASDFWDVAEPAVFSAAEEAGFRALELLTWDAALQSRLREQGWNRVRSINRGSRAGSAPLPASPALPPTLTSFAGGRNTPNVAPLLGGETDIDQLIEVNNLAFAEHPDAGEWDRTELDKLFSEPWFDPMGLLVARVGEMLTGFCWTKVHPDGVGEIYLLAVRPGHTGRGLGRALATAGVDYLSGERACPEVIIYWDASDETANSLYQSIGFSVDRLAQVFQHRL
jgi:mycothiol synthase